MDIRVTKDDGGYHVTYSTCDYEGKPMTREFDHYITWRVAADITERLVMSHRVERDQKTPSRTQSRLLRYLTTCLEQM